MLVLSVAQPSSIFLRYRTDPQRVKIFSEREKCGKWSYYITHNNKNEWKWWKKMFHHKLFHSILSAQEKIAEALTCLGLVQLSYLITSVFFLFVLAVQYHICTINITICKPDKKVVLLTKMLINGWLSSVRYKYKPGYKPCDLL